MSITLTTVELATLTSMETQAQARQIGFWQIDQWLGDLLQAKGISATDPTLLWLRGATEANAGRGAFFELIRSYTEAQYQLRYGTGIPAGKMREASDAVAQNLIDDLLGRNAGWPKGQVPDIARIAFADATAVGIELFGSKLNHDESDTAFSQNSAWSGALLFSLLRSDQTGLLTSTGSAGVLDTLNDLRDVLYAYIAYAKGWSASRDVFLLNNLAGAGGSVEASKQVFIDTQIMGATFVGYYSQPGGSFTSLKQSILLGATGVVGEAFKRIDDIGPNRFLDMVLGAAQGKPLIGTITDANFAVKAKEFFGALSPVALQSLSVRLLPTDASSLAALAKTDVNVRAALAGLSTISVQVSPEIAARLALADPATGSGEITQRWIEDRALMTSYVARSEWTSGFKFSPTAGESVTYRDMGSRAQVLLGAADALQRAQVVFGSDASESIEGFGRNDHLYGGAGNDTLNGQGGNDYLEGNSGANVLDGGDGNDNLLGGIDNDTLDGGLGNDTLNGGRGLDTYKFFTSADESGKDVIIDADGSGLITADGVPLNGVGATKVGEGVWRSADRRYTYAPGRLHVTSLDAEPV